MPLSLYFTVLVQQFQHLGGLWDHADPRENDACRTIIYSSFCYLLNTEAYTEA